MTYRITRHAIDRLWERFPSTRDMSFKESCEFLREMLQEAHDLNLFFDNPDPQNPNQLVAYFQVECGEVFAIVKDRRVITVWPAMPMLFRDGDHNDVNYTEILYTAQATYACMDNYQEAA